MVKNNNKNKSSKKRNVQSGGVRKRRGGNNTRPGRMVGPALDGYAARWARLLADPCGAPMVQGCYPGSGSGILLRFQSWVNILSSSNTDFQFTFTPGLNRYAFGQTVGGATGLVGGAISPFNLAFYDSYRCVAACARVMYAGTEGNRSGLVGSAITASPVIEPNQGNVGSFGLMPVMQKISRTGECVHETKWIPSVQDQNFVGTMDIPLATYDRGTITICGSGIPTGGIQVLLTAVYEVIPEYGAGLIASQSIPPSRNTVTDVLRALGDASTWAFSHVVAPVLKASAGLAVQSMNYAPQIASGAARLALTY